MKRTIDRFALAVGAALAMYGAYWMWTGWDIVQVERGWASLISGAVMMTGGLIICVVSWSTMRLASVLERAVAPAIAAAPSHASAPPLAESQPAASPVMERAARGMAAPGAIVAASTAAVAAAAVAASTPAKAEQDEEAPDRSAQDEFQFSAPPKPPTVGELLRMGENRAAQELESPEVEKEPAIEPAPEAANAHEPPPVEPLPIDEAPVRKDEEPSPEIAEPPVAEPAAAVEEAPVAPEKIEVAAPPADELVHDDWLEQTARELDAQLGRSTIQKEAEPKSAAVETPPPPPPEPAVVGRYSSGDTNYLMFADGSIEAQTPEGVMRFASLTELKRFVETRH